MKVCFKGALNWASPLAGEAGAPTARLMGGNARSANGALRTSALRAVPPICLAAVAASHLPPQGGKAKERAA